MQQEFVALRRNADKTAEDRRLLDGNLAKIREELDRLELTSTRRRESVGSLASDEGRFY